MHRTITISLPSHATDALLAALKRQPDVIGLGVSRGASLKPVGDIVTVHALNRGSDAVLRAAGQAGPDVSIVTAETTSIIDPQHDAQIENDVDEALWEEYVPPAEFATRDHHA
jgi:hypothetical protein